MEEIKKAKISFNRTQCNLLHRWFCQAQILRFSNPWLRWSFFKNDKVVKVTRSNSSAVIPYSYYSETVYALKLYPILLQTDCSVENSITVGIQCHFANDINAHEYGSPPSNQRMENFWSHHKGGYSFLDNRLFLKIPWIMQLHFGNYVHMECAWVSFAPFIQCELKKVERDGIHISYQNLDMIPFLVNLMSYTLYRRKLGTKIRE